MHIKEKKENVDLKMEVPYLVWPLVWYMIWSLLVGLCKMWVPTMISTYRLLVFDWDTAPLFHPRDTRTGRLCIHLCDNETCVVRFMLIMVVLLLLWSFSARLVGLVHDDRYIWYDGAWATYEYSIYQQFCRNNSGVVTIARCSHQFSTLGWYTHCPLAWLLLHDGTQFGRKTSIKFSSLSIELSSSSNKLSSPLVYLVMSAYGLTSNAYERARCLRQLCFATVICVISMQMRWWRFMPKNWTTLWAYSIAYWIDHDVSLIGLSQVNE